MSGWGPVAKRATKMAVKYGPQAKVAWDIGGEQAKQAAQRALAARAAKRSAVAKARTLAAGSVLKVVHDAEPVWLVYAGDRPVDAYPRREVPLAELAADADLTARRTPAELDEARLHRRARRVVRRGRPGGRTGTGPAGLPPGATPPDPTE